MCGILGLIIADEANDTACSHQLHEALYTLQHRGQDAAGIATCAAGGRIFQLKGNGRAEGVFKNGARLSNLPGYMGVGHLRYPTAGSSASSEAQPIYVNSPYGIVLTHNGNLTNSRELKEYLDKEAHRHINTDSDSELILNIFAHELSRFQKARVNSQDLVEALRVTYEKSQGAYSCIAMLAGYGLLGFRDSFGIRPLIIGKRGDDYMMASESPALRQRGFEIIRDVAPGELVIIERGKGPAFFQVEERKGYRPDIFEWVYFSRPDSIIDNIPVLRARQNFGYALAEAIKRELSPEDLAAIDVVIPVPETSLPSAECVAKGLSKRYAGGFVKNRYVFRTFIEVGQKNRESSVRRKLSPVDIEFAGKTVLLIDDSIVRGTTSREIVSLAKAAGAVKVYFASCAPRITYPHIHGIDLASPSELIAHHRDNEAIAKHLGAEKVIFQDLDDLKKACKDACTVENGPEDFEVGLFCGNYCTPVTPEYFEHLEKLRGEKKKKKQLQEAREAVANGYADATQHSTVTGQEAYSVPGLNGLTLPSKAQAATTPGERMDINLHNFGDHD